MNVEDLYEMCGQKFDEIDKRLEELSSDVYARLNYLHDILTEHSKTLIHMVSKYNRVESEYQAIKQLVPKKTLEQINEDWLNSKKSFRHVKINGGEDDVNQVRFSYNDT